MPAKARWRRPISLTPLIDVIFLLLLFFMLTSTFSRFAEVEIAGAGGPAGDAPPLFLRVAPEGWSLNGAPVAPEDLAGIVAERRTAEPQPVIVSAAEGLTAQGLVDVLGALAALPDLAVAVVR